MKKFLAVLVLCLCTCTFFPNFAAAGLISKEEEIQMGRGAAQQLEAKYGLYQEPEAVERVNRIGQSLVAVCDRKDLAYTFKILNTPDVNAVSCPGGFVYVFKGLLDYMPSDAELAGVMGHEIGHVVKKHTVNQIEKNLWTTLALVIATGGRDIGLASVAAQALAAGYSRTDERGADKEGFTYSVRAGYNPYSMLITLKKLDDLAKAQKTPSYGLFNDHPEPEERVARITKMQESLQIHPDVLLGKDGTASVVEGNWRFNLPGAHGNDKAEYRAYELAGSLYCVRQRGKIAPERFIVDDQGSAATIYYDDLQVLRLYSQDVPSGFDSVGSYANACTSLLRDWSDLANAKMVVQGTKSGNAGTKAKTTSKYLLQNRVQGTSKVQDLLPQKQVAAPTTVTKGADAKIAPVQAAPVHSATTNQALKPAA